MVPLVLCKNELRLVKIALITRAQGGAFKLLGKINDS
jgi:hypothetical protein